MMIEEYFGSLSEEGREKLQLVKQAIREAAPEAEEVMSYGVPAFRLNKKTVMYAAFREHIGLYPTPAVIEHFKDELSNYETATGTIKFPLDQELPFPLIKKICKFAFGLK